ncbi:hypothetical protein MHK_001802 [Candidatus Magnetomorum sp. HK-1]|nr:hypothetical protein MHK_001802 [Candidatus Magnetomorum sp. HK-1]
METFKLNDLIIEIVYDPSGSLSNHKKERLAREAIQLTRLAFQNPKMNEKMIIRRSITYVSTGVYLRDVNGNLIAYNTVVTEQVMTKKVMHILILSVSPEYQKRGLIEILQSLCLLKEAELHDPDSLFFGARTQSPIVCNLYIKKFGTYPRPWEQTPDNLKLIAEAYAEVIQKKYTLINSFNYDRDNLILKGAFGKITRDGKEKKCSLYSGKFPWSRNEEINDFFKNKLSLDKGDGIICIGPFNRNVCFDNCAGIANFHIS